MSEIPKYHKIHAPNSTNGRLVIDKFKDTSVIVMEKVHGANFRITVLAKDNIVFSRRNGDLAEDENFCKYWTIRDVLVERVQRLRDILVEIVDEGELQHFQVIGELCGGSYPGLKAEVPMVQKGVFYTNRLEFLPFDLKINGKMHPYREAMVWLEQSGFQPLPILGECILSEVSHQFDVESMCSAVPEMLGMPPISDNLIEGIVVKTNEPLYTDRGCYRAILKIKRGSFMERSAKTPRISAKPGVELSEEWQDALDKLLTYVCDNRLDSVLSKEGELDPSRISRIGGLLSKDAIDDYKAEGGSWPEEDPKIRKIFGKATLKVAFQIVRNRLNVM